MNNTEVVSQISKQTGVDAETCNGIIKKVEEIAGGAVAGKLTGKQMDVAGIAEKVATALKLPKDVCEKVIAALNDLLSKGLLDKINPFKK